MKLTSVFRKKRTFAILFVMLIALLYLKEDWIGRTIYPIHYEKDIRISGLNYQVNPLLIAAIIRVETNYKLNKESSKGALGIMQLMPNTANWIVEQAGYTQTTTDELATRADINIEAGAWYLRWLLNQFDGDEMAAIAAYNAGPGNVRKWMAADTWNGSESKVSMIPFGETRHYVQRVVYYYKKYKQYYSEQAEN